MLSYSNLKCIEMRTELLRDLFILAKKLNKMQTEQIF